jgi:hypothetical protein
MPIDFSSMISELIHIEILIPPRSNHPITLWPLVLVLEAFPSNASIVLSVFRSCTVDQVIICWLLKLLTVENRVQFEVFQGGNCNGRSGRGAGFFPEFLVFLDQVIPPVPCTYVTMPKMCIRPDQAAYHCLSP